MFLKWPFGDFGTTISSFAHLKVGELKRRSLNLVTTGRFKEVVFKLVSKTRMLYLFTLNSFEKLRI